MPTIKFSTGQEVSFSGEPTKEDIEKLQSSLGISDSLTKKEKAEARKFITTEPRNERIEEGKPVSSDSRFEKTGRKTRRPSSAVFAELTRPIASVLTAIPKGKEVVDGVRAGEEASFSPINTRAYGDLFLPGNKAKFDLQQREEAGEEITSEDRRKTNTKSLSQGFGTALELASLGLGGVGFQAGTQALKAGLTSGSKALVGSGAKQLGKFAATEGAANAIGEFGYRLQNTEEGDTVGDVARGAVGDTVAGGTVAVVLGSIAAGLLYGGTKALNTIPGVRVNASFRQLREPIIDALAKTKNKDEAASLLRAQFQDAPQELIDTKASRIVDIDTTDGVIRELNDGKVVVKETPVESTVRDIEAGEPVNLDLENTTRRLDVIDELKSRNMDADFDRLISEDIARRVDLNDSKVAKRVAKLESVDTKLKDLQSEVSTMESRIVELQDKVINNINFEFNSAKLRGLQREYNTLTAALTKRYAQMAKVRNMKIAQMPAKNVKSYIEKNIIGKPELEQRLLLQRLEMQATQARLRGELGVSEKAVEAMNQINEQAYKELGDVSAKIVQYEKANTEIIKDMFASKNALEYTMEEAQSAYNLVSFQLDDINKFFKKMNKKQLVDFFNAREAGTITKGSEFYKVNQKITEMTKGISDILEKFDVLGERFDDNRYLQTRLESLDGTKASDEAINKLRKDMMLNDGKASLQSLLQEGQSIKDSMGNARKYTSDQRDEVLRGYGLRTARDPQKAVINYAFQSAGLIKKLVMSDTLRRLADQGFAPNQLRQVYKPEDLINFRSNLNREMKKSLNEILDIARRQKVLSKDTVRVLKNTQKQMNDYDIELDIEELKNLDDKSLNEIFQDLLNNLELSNSKLKNDIIKKVEDIKMGYKKQLIDKYADIALESNRLKEEGFLPIAGRGRLRGAQGLFAKKNSGTLAVFQESPYDWIIAQEQIISKNSLLNIVDGIGALQKLAMATLDFFTGAIAASVLFTRVNPYRAAIIFKEAITGNAARNITPEGKAFASKFMRVGRDNIADLEPILEELSIIQRGQEGVISRMGDKAMSVLDNAKLGNAARKIHDVWKKFEDFQFITFTDGVKFQLLEDGAQDLIRKGVSEREAYEEIGRVIDLNFGLADMRDLEIKYPNVMNKANQQLMRLFLFSPTLLTATFQRLGNARYIFENSVRGAVVRDTTLKTLLYSMAILQGVNMSLNGGKTTFENEDPDRWMDVQVPFLRDEQGNPYYINVTGRLLDVVRMVNKPGRFLSNKVSPIINLTSSIANPNEFQEREGNIVGNALLDTLPIPFALSSIVTGTAGMLNDNDDEYGVPTSAVGLAATSLLSSIGLAGNYISDKSSQESTTNIIRQFYRGLSEGDSSKYLAKGTGLRLLTGGQKKEREEVLMGRYGIETSSISKYEDFLKMQDMDETDFADFVTNASDTAKNNITRWALAEQEEELSRRELGRLYYEAGIYSKDRAAKASTYESYQLKRRIIRKEELTQELTQSFNALLGSGAIQKSQYELLVSKIDEQFMTPKEIENKLVNEELDKRLENGTITKEQYDQVYID